MRKLIFITWNDLRQTLGDRSLLLLMFAAPLAVATIISVSFGSAAREVSPIESIPLAIVNHDLGSPLADFGEAFVSVLQPRGEETGGEADGSSDARADVMVALGMA